MKKTPGTNKFRAKPALPPQEQTCLLLHQRSGHHLELLEAIQSNQGSLPANDIQQQNTSDEQPTIPLSEYRSFDMESIERPIQPERTAEPLSEPANEFDENQYDNYDGDGDDDEEEFDGGNAFDHFNNDFNNGGESDDDSESNEPPVPVNDVNNGSNGDGGDDGDDGNDEYYDLSGDVNDNPAYPFKNEYRMHALLFFKSGSFKYSEVQIKSVLDFGKYMAEIAIKEYRAQLALDHSDVIYDFRNYPTPHSVSRFHKSKKSCIPCFSHAPHCAKDNNGGLLVEPTEPATSTSTSGTATVADASAPAPASTSAPANTSAPATDPAATTNTTASAPAVPVVVASKPDLFLNDVSEHLRLLVGNPCMSGFLSDLPDRTPNQRIKLSQGEKWNCDRLFEHPMISTGPNLQLWVSDKVSLLSESNIPLRDRQYFKVAKIFQISKVVNVDLYPIKPDNNLGICCLYDILLNYPITDFDINNVFRAEHESFDAFTSLQHINGDDYHCSRDVVANTRLIRAHQDMIDTGNKYKRPLPIRSRIKSINPNSSNYQVVRVIPYNLCSDDTSGNSTSKWNCFYSWSMNPAAVPLSVANHYLNQFFINGSNRHTAMEQLPSLVPDLKKLETGLPMFDAMFKEEVFVVAPLLFIKADNPCHAGVTCLKASTATYPCRKCFWCRHADAFDPNRITTAEEHMSVPNDDSNSTDFSIRVRNKQGDYIMVENLMDLGFKETSGKRLLTLSSWDPSKDTPVEILHGLCLGLIIYTFNKAPDCFFDKKQVDRISFYQFVDASQRIQKLSLRDFKLTIQMLPIVLRVARDHIDFLNLCNDQFHRMLGELCSSCYNCEIHNNFSAYLDLLRQYVDDTVIDLDNLDRTVVPSNRRTRGEPATATTTASVRSQTTFEEIYGLSGEQCNGATIPYAKTGGSLCNRLKTHLIVHLVEDCLQFASPVLLATEKNEQFNKRIRAIVMKTNKQNPSRDLALIYGREVMLRSIAMGLVWDNGMKTRGSLVKAWFDRYSKDMYYSANQEFGSTEYIARKKIALT
ncbi:uncharacterized protein EV154DRAFT_557103 [Mucor mucedo]|uniref:uncharacterized protein n=1 Tax=Mucor mucedo TaxID=29922 RepID=UPI00221ECC35|nr:uncharacterized protein EV154DRAFT_557103 [Mucor mucedo]KAI7866676.1 hypothetical protein EV154DRAFT_557103 [Mucor mucedo]